MTTPPTPTFLTTNEAAAILRVHTSTISRYVARGELTAVKIGHKLLIPRDALDELVARHTQHAVPAPPTQPRAPRPLPADREQLRREYPHLARSHRQSA